MITGGIGGGAMDLFNAKGIEVISGASGNADTVVGEFLQGNLKSAGSNCHHDSHHHSNHTHHHSHDCGHE